MTIKALRPVVVSGTRSLGPGEIADDLPEHVARAIVATGKAVPFTRPAPVVDAPPAASPVVETAAVQPVVETATPKPRRQSRKP